MIKPKPPLPENPELEAYAHKQMVFSILDTLSYNYVAETVDDAIVCWRTDLDKYLREYAEISAEAHRHAQPIRETHTQLRDLLRYAPGCLLITRFEEKQRSDASRR